MIYYKATHLETGKVFYRESKKNELNEIALEIINSKEKSEFINLAQMEGLEAFLFKRIMQKPKPIIPKLRKKLKRRKKNTII